MKKRVILLASSLFLIALLLLYAISLITITNENKNKAREEINIYLTVASKEFDPETANYQEVSSYMLSLDKRLRITFIASDGKVIYDSTLLYNVDNLDNHLNRPEIENVGEVVIRKSSSTNKDMMYVATIKGDTYLRISFDTTNFTTGTILYAVVAAIAIVAIFAVLIVVLYFVSKRMLKPIDAKINELATIADTDVVFKTDTIDQLPTIINNLKFLINNKIEQIKEENIKNETIIQAIDEGLILLKNENITAVNHQTLKLFKVNEESIIGKNYLYLFRNTTLLEAIKNAIATRKNAQVMIVIDNRVYEVYLIPFNSAQMLISLKDITEREKIEQIKKDFFANASHELKSPLTSIIGYEQMILNGIIEDKSEIKDASLKILKEANRMNQIIIDMLELSNLEFSQTYDVKEYDIAGLLQEVIKSYQAKIKTKNIILKTQIEDAKLECNYEQMETLFSNIIDNAIKYNKDGGTLNIHLDSNCFSCQDSGIGIPDEDKLRVFERFYRVDKAKSKESGGTGLGLAIVKHICEKFNYQIKLDSKLGVGTTITINFHNDYNL